MGYRTRVECMGGPSDSLFSLLYALTIVSHTQSSFPIKPQLCTEFVTGYRALETMPHSMGRSVDTGENGYISSPKSPLAGTGRTVHRRNAPGSTLSTAANTEPFTRDHSRINTHYRRSFPAASEDTDRSLSHNDRISKRTRKPPTVPSPTPHHPPLATYDEPTPTTNSFHILDLLKSIVEAFIYYITLIPLLLFTLVTASLILVLEVLVFVVCPIADELTNLGSYGVLHLLIISLGLVFVQQLVEHFSFL